MMKFIPENRRAH